MFSQRIDTSIDYNRGLHAPIRWAHVAWAAIWPVADALLGWTRHPKARHWAPLLLFTIAAVLILLPQDLAVSRATHAWFNGAGGDIRRELEAIQQFGQGLSMILIALVIILLDPRNRARVLDWGAAALIALVSTNALKVLVGRPRPQFADPSGFVGPLGAYAMEKDGNARLVTVWSDGYSLASMPSRHAAFAVLAAVFLSFLYPRLRWVVFALAILVCIGRVATNAHFPSDTVAGAALGLLIGRYAVAGEWGQRTLGWIVRHWPSKRR